ncbi:MAG: nucleotidyl transferase AbiEii/AbiGii toxin family protein [Bacteroidia bacterium]|nr:nucleotidyl transferase AbiEii/AbiGii toxin family protein [Bacteroidia bacterium]
MLQKEAIKPHVLELLKTLQADKTFAPFHLAGGTGLALQLGHRLSVDLDLFSLMPFDIDSYLDYLDKKYQFVLDFSALNTLKGSIGEVKIDFISHPYKLLMPVIETEEIRLYSKSDIAAMKVNAIAGNGTRSKDFVDLYFLLIQYSIKEILEFYKTKYNDRNSFHAFKSLNYFDEVDLADWPVLMKNKNVTWDKVKTTIDKLCKEYLKSL